MSGRNRRPIVEFYRDPAQDTPRRTPRRRYLILTSPRTGSSWLAATLAATGEAGVPTEYLHPGVMNYFSEWAGRAFNPRRFFAELAPRRTTPNGLFGLKLLTGQTFFALTQNEHRTYLANALLGYFDQIIYLYRRDKIAQGMSFYVANQTGIYQTETARAQAQLRTEKSALDFDEGQVGGYIAHVIGEDAYARRLIHEHGLTPLTVAYEDLLADPAGEFGRIFDFLGVGADPATIEAPTYKARDAELEAKTEAFRSWLNGQGELG